MPGLFEDLIPDSGKNIPYGPTPADTEAAPPSMPSSNPFEDLVPVQAKDTRLEPAPEAPVAGAPSAPAPNPFADLIPGGKPALPETATTPAGILSTFGSEAAKAAIGLPGEALKGIGVAAGAIEGEGPIQQGAIYRAGDALTKYADTWGATDDSIKANPIAAVAGATVGGFGAALPAVAASVVGAPAALTGGLAAGTLAAFAAAGAGSTFNEALLKGADENTAAKAAGLGAIVAGGLGALPLGLILSPVRAFAPELSGWAATTLEKAVVGGLVFTTVGEAQEFLGRQIAKNFYDPEAGYSPDVTRALGSLIGGGIIGVVTPAMLHHQQTNPVTDESLRRAGTGITAETPADRPPNAVTFDQGTTPQPGTLDALAQTIEGQPGANIGRLATLLGPKLYGEPRNLAQVSVKEMVQNAFDAVKGLSPDEISRGKINIDLNAGDRDITVTDTGAGMRPEVLANQFLQIAGTEKTTTQASGGLGIAKMLFLFGNQEVEVHTMRDGKVATLKTTGPELMSALSGGQKPKIDVQEVSGLSRPLQASLAKLFPDGHGTSVRVKVPETYKDTSTGETKKIDFPTYSFQHPVLERSPLLHPIDVTLNGKTLPIGRSFPAQDFTQFANVKFDWGDARIYVGGPDSAKYGENMHILSNGLWQFSGNLKADPKDPYGDNIKRQFFIDVGSRARPEDPGYPFDLNRQRLTQQAQDDFGKIFNHISKMYQLLDFQSEAKSFGNVQYVEKGGKLSAPEDITPEIPGGKASVAAIAAGDKISVENGKLVVNGRVIPELTKADLESKAYDSKTLKIDQSKIDPNKVMIHNNVMVKPFPGLSDEMSLTDYARSRWGPKFDTFMHGLGSVFKDMRDFAADKVVDIPGYPHNYQEMRREAIGLSFDDTYRGVSIRVPFSGSFINPARPEFVSSPDLAALGYFGTMVHELAHHIVRGHDEDFPAEMQRLAILIEDRAQEFKDRLKAAARGNFEIIQGLNNVLDTGSPRTVGNRFKESSAFQTRDAGAPSDVVRPGDRGRDAGIFARSRQSVEPPERKSDANRVSEEASGLTGEPDPKKGFLGYHGSAEDFRQFDPARIGTNEGTAFGRGFYIAGNPATGARYQDRNANYYYNGRPYDATIPQHRAALLLQEKGSLGAAIEYAETSAARGTISPAYEKAAAIDGAAARVLRSGEVLSPLLRRGNLYTVEVKRPEDHFLDWNRTLAEQSKYVQDALAKTGAKFSPTETGESIMELLSSVSDRAAADALHGAGLAGVKYLDAGSRNVAPENQTRNYVVFDHGDLEITHRNGERLPVETQKAISDVQKGVPVETDSAGRAIVNGYTVESIAPDEMQGFAAKGTPGTGEGARPNGYSVNEKTMNDAGITDFPKTPVTEASTAGRGMLGGLFPKGAPPEMKAAAVGVDHFWQKVRALWDMRAVVDANPHIEPLVRMEVVRDHMNNEATDRQVLAEDTWRVANKLSEVQKQAVYRFIDDFVNMRYLSADERQKQVIRKPTQAEFDAMVKAAKMDQQGLSVFSRMQRDFEKFTRDMMNNMRAEALDTLSPAKQARELARIDGLERALLDKPYFPVSRFGLFTVLVQGPDGPAFYRTETKAEQSRLVKKLNAGKKPGETITTGKMPQSSLPFSGLPVQLLEFIEQKLMPQSKEAEDLRNAIGQLKYESSPVKGITSRLANANLVPGYSQDFFRSYASFFYHGSRYLARQKYNRDLKGALTDLWDSVQGAPDGTKRAEIAQFAQDHYERMLDPRGDWAITRSFMFHMALGFRAASAAANLTQTLISTFPHLAATFGDATTLRSMAKAGADWHNFYSRASVAGMTEPQMRALHELMQLGRIRGALAPELAGISEGRNFARGYGPSIATAWTQFTKMSAGMFEMTEQFNRRVAGMATYDLALRDPQNKFVQKSIAVDPQLYQELQAKGIPANEAAAIVAAKVMIDRTQFQYSREYRPQYLTGPVGSTIGMFKLFQHRMLWNMYNYPAAATRTLLIMGALGGLQGIPGFQDLNGILKAIAFNVFGKDFDLEDKAREFAVDVLGMKGGNNVWDDPFTVVKGFASRGYGIPALADFIGEWSGVGKIPIPELDRSAAISLNNLLPLDFGVMFGPKAAKDPGNAFADSVSRGMGAFGSYAYNVYKAMMNVKEGPEELRRWEKVAPTFMANMSHAARLYKEGYETSVTGAKVVRYDPHDTENMMEIIATGLGYTPFRTMKEWNRIRAEAEATAFYSVRKEMLLNQYWTAQVAKDTKERDRVIQSIRAYNGQVRGTPAAALAITTDTLEKSIENRYSAKAKQEAGLPTSENEIPLVRSVRRLFPGSEVDVRRTR